MKMLVGLENGNNKENGNIKNENKSMSLNKRIETHLYSRIRIGAKRKGFPANHSERPNVAFCGKQMIGDRLVGHPLDRQFAIAFLHIHVIKVDVLGKSKIADLHDETVGQKNVSSGQIQMQ